MSAKKRKKKHISHIPHQIKKSELKSKSRIIWVMALFFGLAGLGVAALSTDSSISWMIGATILGVLIGIVAGKKLQKEIPG